MVGYTHSTMNMLSFRAACAAVLLLVASGSAVLAQQPVGVTVIVNGNTMQFDQPPIEQAGRIFVPLRGVFEQLGASVVYQNGTINATGNGRNISLQIGSTNATINGQPQTLDSPPFVQGSRTLVPLRFVAQALGANVDWNNGTSTVTITSGGYHGGPGSNRPGPNRPGFNGPPRPPMNGAAFLTNQSPVGRANPLSTVSAQFTQPMRTDSLRVTIDGNDVTSQLLFNSGGFQYTSRRPFFPGTHTVRVSGMTRAGASFSTSWDFRV
jgi:Copper amine oxidase N-terminal domain